MTERKMRKLLLASIPLETERLTIRYIDADDAVDMYEYASIPEVCDFLLWSPHINLTATEGYIEFLQKRYSKGLYADWAVTLKENGKMIGTCGFASIDSSDKSCEIGYVLSPHFRGKGYMSEAVEAVLNLAFNKLNISCACLRIISENSNSVKLAKRMGFSYDSSIDMEIKGFMRKVDRFILMKEEYCQKNEAV